MFLGRVQHYFWKIIEAQKKSNQNFFLIAKDYLNILNISRHLFKYKYTSDQNFIQINDSTAFIAFLVN